MSLFGISTIAYGGVAKVSLQNSRPAGVRFRSPKQLSKSRAALVSFEESKININRSPDLKMFKEEQARRQETNDEEQNTFELDPARIGEVFHKLENAKSAN
jgi:hypothetical protein